MMENLFTVQSYNPRSHVVVNTNTTAIVYRKEDLWQTVVVCDLLNQIEFCNKRIALLGNMTMNRNEWKFITEYYRVTRMEAVNAAAVVGGAPPIKYCGGCKDQDRKVQAVYLGNENYYCELHAGVCGHTTERIW